MRKHLGATLAAIIFLFASASITNAQSALFIYNDNAGVPNAGTYHPGDSFTFSISLSFVPGGSIQNLEGLTYFFQQTVPSIAPFPFSITLRNVTGSMFTDLQTPGLTYPQNMNPQTTKDLGALLPGSQPAVGAGTYFIADITVSIPLNAPTSGTFTISNTFSGGRASVITDDLGDTFGIPEADYFITMVPEPATWLTPMLAIFALAYFQRRKLFLRAARSA
jgi:hypothetical protein